MHSNRSLILSSRKPFIHFFTFAPALFAFAVPGESFSDDEYKWKSDVEVGFIMTQGNTDTQSTNAKFNLLAERTAWRHEAHLEGLASSTDGSTTAEKYLAQGKSDYKFSERNYVFGALKYEADRFSGYDYQASETVGYGRRAINTPSAVLDLEAGLGARQSKTDLGKETSEGIVRGAANFSLNISPTAVFTEQFTVEAGKDSTISTSVTALKAKVNASLAMKLSYTVKHNSNPPDDADDTDSETAVTLIYTLI